ncbi:PREDICTED: SAC3 family protein A [Tarenaya hassleriana]|uniref:SAC3 family protein A n=1 Tax=Tarenaya hassleriana TaxID=28532 RepID=UPI00053C30EA|nr:PREDICTED: SAC3 family protein A [Tarenaya hassleriana]
MNQGANTQAVATLDPNSIENRYGVDGSQIQSSSYQYLSGSDTSTWTTNRVENQAVENGNYSSLNYYQPQPTEQATRTVQEASNSVPVPSSSTSGTANVAQEYSGYTSYPSSTDPYNYASTGYSNYYSGYQQQPNHSYTQPVGAYQNTGAPYQPISSFQNTGSYAGTASYSGIYYNPADYQTAGGYPSTSYNNQTAGGYPSTSYGNQTAAWNQGNYAGYTSNTYQTYPPDTSSAHTSSVASTTSVHYQQNYKQWSDYYSQTEVPCAPGTEKLSVSSASSQSFPVPGVTSQIPPSDGQPAPSFVQSWRPETNSSQTPPQPGAAVSVSNDAYWMHNTPSLQSHHPSSTQNHYQSPLEVKHLYETSFQNHQAVAYPQGLNSQSFAHQAPAPPDYHQPPQTPQTAPSLDTRRVSNLQIQTNPRIASNLPLGFTKTDKDSSAVGAAKKPAYVSVSMPKPKDHTTGMPEAGAFPKSLRGFVERAFACCKDDKEKASCQVALKEIISKATADGTLYTRDWDTEPFSSVLNMDMTNELQSSTPTFSLPKKSPTRRSKSRWEPLSEGKPVAKLPTTWSSDLKFGGWSLQSEKETKGLESSQKVDGFTDFKSTYSGPNSAKKNFQRPVKRQRFADGATAAVDNDGSSDSDKEQSLTPYYSSAIALASSAEEKKRRESRSKRFEKSQGRSRQSNNFKSKNASVGNLYSRRATALVLSRNYDDSGSRAVEDIDWDALTVKGTCQEIGKRYLRLTSAPDPSTVRPEDVLEKALLMVQDSQKNYLYKCDQLKSIRQDLTVQRIRNQLTVKVYETHARLALEAGDLPEYNQCLAQLKILYAEGIEGCCLEFAAYDLLYITLHSKHNRELLSSMSRLSDEAKEDEAVKHALSVRAAVTLGNYVTFFRLYKTAPNMNSCLMDLYVEKMRFKAVNCMARAYRPTVPVSYLAQVLGFTENSSEGGDEKENGGMEECLEWLKAHGASLISDSSGELLLDAKASSSSLCMPEPEDAVAHGDRNLAVNDFFTRTLS